MTNKIRKPKPIFKEGPISPESIAKSIANHQDKTGIGAHSIFMGQVRADDINGQSVVAIDYTANEEMAESVMFEVREAAFEKYDLNCMHIYHSLGRVEVGQICLFVFASSPHRNDCRNATEFIVEELKSKAPIFGKEILSDESHVWKENK